MAIWGGTDATDPLATDSWGTWRAMYFRIFFRSRLTGDTAGRIEMMASKSEANPAGIPASGISEPNPIIKPNAPAKKKKNPK